MIVTPRRLLLGAIFMAGGAAGAWASGFTPDASCPYRIASPAGGRGKTDVAKIYVEADVVLLGRVTESRVVDAAREQGVMKVRVTETIKGAPPAGITVAFSKPNCDNTACGGDGIPAGATEFLFALKGSGPGPYARLGCRPMLALGFVEGTSLRIGAASVERARTKAFLESRPAPVDEP